MHKLQLMLLLPKQIAQAGSQSLATYITYLIIYSALDGLLVDVKAKSILVPIVL